MRDGAIVVMPTQKSFDAMKRKVPKLRSEGTSVDILDRESLRAREPALGEAVAGAIRFGRDARCTDPFEFGAALADYFKRLGGRTIATRATSIEAASAGWRIAYDGGSAHSSIWLLPQAFGRRRF